MSTVHSQFPQELVDQVIDFLYDDPQSLKACFSCMLGVGSTLQIRTFSKPATSSQRASESSATSCSLKTALFSTISARLPPPDSAGIPTITTSTLLRPNWAASQAYMPSLLSFTAAFTHVTRLVLVCNFHPTAEPAQLLSMISHFAALQELSPRDFIPDFSLNAILRTLVMRDCMWMDAGRISNLVAPGLEHLTIELYSRQAADRSQSLACP
ncbi:hypothetical protein C8F04DRAFT_1253615 [Mycena alexandri]|uniref:F-box domain-containing protein n=1 Tax=Mycena alexandri TaxID=1745969 RepID=A0AAD6XCX8_9AGAR|nr:hypothetical protein C8F04DRAFT_1253615 [Mycena alexandri]